MEPQQTASTQERLRYLEGLVSALGGIIWEFDWSTGAFTYVSQAAERLLGFTLDEWMEPGFWANNLHPEDAEWATEFCIASTKALQDHEFEYRMIHRSGATVWVRDIVTVDAEKGMDGRLRGIIVDITDTHQAAELLKRKSLEFDAVFRVMQDLYFRMDSRNVVVDFKAAARDLLYTDPSEILGSRITDLLPQSMREMLDTNLELARETDTMVVTNYELFVGGQRRHWEARFLPMGGGDVVVISRDVTDRHEANMRLAQSQERYQTLVEMSPYAIYVIGMDERVVFCNGSAESMFRCPPGESLVGVSVGALMPADRADSASVRDFYRVAAEVALCQPGDPMPLSKAQRCVTATLDKRVINIERTVSGIRFRGEPALLVLARDITEELEVENALLSSEVRLRDAQNMARMGYYSFEIDEDSWSSSSGLDQVLGISPEYPKTLATWLELIHPDERESMLTYFVEEVAGNGIPFDRDYRVVRPSDGETRWVHGNGQLVFGDDSQPAELFGYIQDITDRKIAEEREHRYSERLSVMASDLTATEDRERRRLAEELHDRVSQQLAVAKLHLNSATEVADECVKPELATAASLIDEAIAQTRAITTQLAPPILYELGLGPALRWQCEDIDRMLGLRVHFSADSDESGVSDEAKMVMFRAVRELLVNVVKHARTPEAWVSMDALPGWLEINVVDQGRGFEVSARTESTGDSGFGLFSIRERLPHLGGEFEFNSEPGKGTRVTLRVPRGATE